MSQISAASLRVLITCAAVAFGCGGKVVFVEDDGPSAQGGSPGGPLGGSPSDGGAPTQPVGGASSGGSTVVGTPASPCQIACNTVFQCGLQSDQNGLLLCPGFNPDNQQAVFTSCNSTCEQNMALVAVVDPGDCEGTIDTLEAVSPGFADTCNFGF